MISTNFVSQYQSGSYAEPQLSSVALYSTPSFSQPTDFYNVSNNVLPSTSDETISRIYELANQDVEMEDAPSGGVLILVIDTNVLIDQLPSIRRFCLDVDALGLPILIIIPSIVLSELDGLKNRESLKWFSQTASSFILGGVRKEITKCLKVQSRKETSNIKDQEDILRKNDIAIFDCCHYFQHKIGRAVLLSGDKNLCIECEKEQILTISPPKRSWTSRELARSLFDLVGINFDAGRFYGHEKAASYRRDRTQRRVGLTEPPHQDDDDRMDVDDDESMTERPEEYVPSHALDGLHLQIIDHFTILIKEVAQRVRRECGEAGPASRSQHAPAYRRKDFTLWTLGDCVEYLGVKKTLKRTQPPLKVFLLKRNEDRGWRRGQDWSRQDWMTALSALEDIGMKYEDGSVMESLAGLRLHVDVIFRTPMRPTGI